MLSNIIDLLRSLEGFEWDEGNSQKNWIKHQVRNAETEQIFFNRPLEISEDTEHSSEEEIRYGALGRTNSNRKLFVVFTIRNNKIRPISARDQDKYERRMYEQIKEVA
jgi:uncharacterized protein